MRNGGGNDQRERGKDSRDAHTNQTRKNDDVLLAMTLAKSSRPVGRWESRGFISKIFKFERTGEELILSDLAEVDRFTDHSLRAVRAATASLDRPTFGANREGRLARSARAASGITNDSLESSDRGVHQSRCPSLSEAIVPGMKLVSPMKSAITRDCGRR